MPELPDIVVYIEALEKRILGEELRRIQLGSPFLLRTAAPPISSAERRKVVDLRRLGKRICFGLEGDLWLVLHLMIAGRLHWKEAEARPLGRAQSSKKGSSSKSPSIKTSKRNLATFEFDNGALTLTEAGTQKRASLHVVAGEAGLRNLDPGGLEIFVRTGSVSDRLNTPSVTPGDHTEIDPAHLAAFASALQSANHTLKRSLTDPRLFSGIGNAYSDEILFAAHLSPIKLTQKLTDAEVERLYVATRGTLGQWVARLRAEAGDSFPEGVTAFRADMAVHGRYKQPCLRCGAKVQRIRYATNETNYCPTCQTGGKLLADRALSRILRDDWPRTAEE
jgi:formamidopyrimidine-DNA glycosylase